MKIIGEIPARIGSKRVEKKNLRLINGKPLISYAIEAAKNANRLTDIYVNSDSDEIGCLGEKLGVKFYKRPVELASDTATSDEFNYDFIKKTGADILVLINPVSPLVESVDIDKIVDFYLKHDYKTVITSSQFYTHAFMDGRPLNFSFDEMLPRTQDLISIDLCSWSVCVWDAHFFVESFERNGSAVFNQPVGLFPLSRLKNVKISYEEDFQMAEALLKYRDSHD